MDRTSHAGSDASLRQARLREAAQVVRDELGSKRSDKLLRLFEFLLERTIAQRPPTELEIANEVYSFGKTIESPRDATVRVSVHRLRKLLDELFKERAGIRLTIPVGEYSILLDGDAEGPVPEEVPAGPDVVSDATPRLADKRRVMVAALCLALPIVLFILFSVGRQPAGGSPARAAIWQNFALSSRPITIVMGDYFLFGEADGDRTAPAAAPPRLVWDRSIPARDDLDIYLMRNPAEAGRVTGFREQYVSSSTIMALNYVEAALRTVEKGHNRPIKVISASRLTPDILKSSDVVYVGLFSGLSELLCDPLLQASGFNLGETSNDLTDKDSGMSYESDGVVLTDERIPRKDYGYIASLPGPTGNTIVVIAGLRDPGLLEMAELVDDPVRIVDSGLGGEAPLRGVEALYRVRAMANLNLGATLILRRELHSQGIWDKSMMVHGSLAASDVPSAASTPR